MNMSKKNLTINYLESQFVVSFDSIIEKPDNAWLNIDNSTILKKNFNQNLLVIPVPNQPELIEVPVVQVSSKDNIRLTLSRARATLFFISKNRKNIYKEESSKITEFTSLFFDEMQKVNSIKWIGFISTFFVESPESQKYISNALTNKFKNLHGGTTKETNLNYVSIIKFLDKKIHNHTEIMEGISKYSDEIKEKRGVIIRRDFNTKAEDNKDQFINKKFIDNFINLSEENFKLEEIIEILWD